MKTVFVTGSAGSLGREIVSRLKMNPEYDIFTSDIVSDSLDLSVIEDVQQLMKNFIAKTGKLQPDIVIHCAATIYGVAGFNNDDYGILSRDTLSTINMIKFFEPTERFVYLSSSMVYERSTYGNGDGGVREDAVLQAKAPLTGYGLSKYIGESLVRFSGVNYTIWRPFNIITPHELPHDEIGYSHVFADYFNNILVNKMTELPIIGDGYQIRAFTWIGDVADCIVNNLENPATDMQDFNIGNPEPITMRGLAHKIFDEAVSRNLIPDGRLTFKTIKQLDRDVRYRAPNIGKARELLGFKPTVNTQRAIELCIDEWEKRL